MALLYITQYQGKIVGPVAWLLGHLMNGIFNVLNAIGIPNIGLRTCKQITKYLSLEDIIAYDEPILFKEVSKIPGIGVSTTQTFCEGIKENKKLLETFFSWK